jgi:hypothetical protein
MCKVYSKNPQANLLCELDPKCPDFVRGQGAIWFKNGAYTAVREYFEANRNAAIGQKMGIWG